MLTVAYVGNYQPASTETHIARSLEALGHTVIRLQENATDAGEVIEAAEASDLLLWTRTWDGGWMAPVIEKLRGQVPTVGVHLDLWHGLARERVLDTEPFFRLDRVVTPNLDDQADFEARGINHRWWRPGVVADECYLAEPGRRVDVLWMGNHTNYHREWPHRRELVRWLERTYRGRVAILPGKGQAVRGEALNVAYASAKVVVGDSCFADRLDFYSSDRPWETMGRGGFYLGPWSESFKADGLVEGEHLACYTPYDWTGLKAKIDHYLANDVEREAIRLAGHEAVKDRCTYTHRMAGVLAMLTDEGLLPSTSWPDDGDPATDILVDEIYVQDVYRTLPHLRKGGTVVDVGANVGVFSVWAAQHGAKVVAVEANTDLMGRLRANVEKAAVKVDIRHAAVWNVSHLRGSIVGGHGAGRFVFGGEDVGTLSLDDLLATVDGDVDVLKVDVEGAEWAIFSSVPSTLLGRCRYITIETHPWGEDGFGFGDLVRLLAETHHVETLGAPSRGAYIFARRFGS